MNRVVRDRYPVSKLPEDLRNGAGSDAIATVTVEIEAAGPKTRPFREIFAALHDRRVLSDDPVMRVRALREEWDERERWLSDIHRGGTE